METGLSRVTHARVEGLFGMYTHDIDLNLDSRVTIIHGPNGVGKTVLLRLISSLFAGQYIYLARVPFRSFTISLSDGRSIAVMGSDLDHSMKGKREIAVSVISAEGTQETNLRLDSSILVHHAARIEREFDWLSRSGPDEWVDMRTGERLDAEDVVYTYGPDSEGPQNFFQEPPWLAEARTAVAVHLIETQRLLKFRVSESGETRSLYRYRMERAPTSAVKSYAVELRQIVSTTLARYASESQTLDQTFPERLLSGEAAALGTEDLKRHMSELGNLRDELSKIGLVEEVVNYPFNVETLENLDDTKRTVMTLYVTDQDRKLRVLEDLSRRIGLLIQIVNRKFRHKQLEVSEGTLIAVDSQGNRLDLDALSSGEQHELVLTYDLLFKVRTNALVLIDEPELSLHVVWQKAFLPDISSIVEARKFDVLVATHSPYIVGDSQALMVELSDELPARLR